MALNFPIPTSVGQVYQDPTSGNTYVCTSLGPPAQWVGSGSSTSLDSTYLRTDASNDPVTGNLLLNPTTNVSPLTLQQPVGNTTPALKIENSGSGNSIEANGFSVSQAGNLSINETLTFTDTVPNKTISTLGKDLISATTDDDVRNLIGLSAITNRNRLINGGMAIDQRNNGAVQTITAGSALAYTVDRWYGYAVGANITGQQVQGVTAGQFRYQFTGASGCTSIGFAQRIEQLNCADLAGSTATLSVDLANSLLNTVTWTVFYANTANTFGTLASPTKTQFATGTFTVNSTVSRYSTQISIPIEAVTGIEVLFTVGAQTSGTWTIGDVQLEPGSVATPFERRFYGTELTLCQRYLQLIGGSATAGDQYLMTGMCNTNVQARFVYKYPVDLRAIPSVSFPPVNTFQVYSGAANPTGTAIAQVSVNDPRWLSLSVTVASGLAAGNGAILLSLGATPIRVSAEL